MRFTETALVAALDAQTVAKGRHVRASGAVLSLDVEPNGTRIVSTVASSNRYGAPSPHYRQTIDIAKRSGRLRVRGDCTCPMVFNCKHVAAVLLEYTMRPDDVRDEADIPGNSATNMNAPSGTALSDNVSTWLERVVSAAAPITTNDASRKNARTLLFVLDPVGVYKADDLSRVVVRTLSSRVRKDGSICDETPYLPKNARLPRPQIARYVSDGDVSILRDLFGFQSRSGGFLSENDIALPSGPMSRYVLDAMLATGRMRYQKVDGPKLVSGPDEPGIAAWAMAERGNQQLRFVPKVRERKDDAIANPERGGEAGAPVCFDRVLAFDPPHYIDLSLVREGTARIGVITSELAPSLALEVARGPLVAPSEAVHVSAMLLDRLHQRDPGRSDVEPESATKRELETGEPERRASPGTAKTSRKLRKAAKSGQKKKSPLPNASGPAVKSVGVGRLQVPLPEAALEIELRKVTPKPRLELFSSMARWKPRFSYYADRANIPRSLDLPLARLSFDYDGDIVPFGERMLTQERVENGKLIVISRDHDMEKTARKLLNELDLVELSTLPVAFTDAQDGDLFLTPQRHGSIYDRIERIDEPSRFISFSMHTVPALMEQGWEIVIADDYPFRVADGEPQWWAKLDEEANDKGSGIDWFSFELGIEFEGHRINLVPHLARLIEQLPNGPAGAEPIAMETLLAKMKLFHTLPDGRLLPLPGERLAPMVKGLLDLVGPRKASLVDGSVRLHRAEAPALANFADITQTDVAWAASAKRLVSLGKQLQANRPRRTVKPPRTFKAKLRPYQIDSLNWLEFLRESGFGGVLADDMGLGKTVQALAFLAREKARGRLDKPALIIAPTSVLPNWRAEIERFAPNLSVLVLRGPDRRQLFDQIGSHDLVLSTYPLLVRDEAVLLEHEYHVAILDEAQAIKNPKATVAKIAHRIKSNHRLALTGTPLENNLGEVWSLFEFLAPGLLGDALSFRRLFRTPIEKHGDTQAQEFLSRRLKPFMLRRTKSEVAKELPEKVEIIERITLEGAQRDLYETVRSVMHKKVRDEIAKKGLAKSHIIFLEALLKLRQVCCDPRLLKMPQARRVKQSAKLVRLVEMLPELIGEGRRILLFSQFTSMLALIETELKALKIPYVQLTGKTVDRAEPVARFQAGEVPVFLLSLKAGGTGLNLTAADTVIHYDPWWNPAVENQATDRAHRIGQQSQVFVYKFIVEEGIEQAIELLKARKAALADALFAGRAQKPFDLTEDDISTLFAPLNPTRKKLVA